MKTVIDATEKFKRWDYPRFSALSYEPSTGLWFFHNSCERNKNHQFVCTFQEFDTEVTRRRGVQTSKINEIDNCCGTTCNKILLIQQHKELVQALSDVIGVTEHYGYGEDPHYPEYTKAVQLLESLK